MTSFLSGSLKYSRAFLKERRLAAGSLSVMSGQHACKSRPATMMKETEKKNFLI